MTTWLVLIGWVLLMLVFVITTMSITANVIMEVLQNAF